MDNLAKLVAAFFLIFFACLANAGYAQLADPSGFSGSSGDFRFAPSANDARYGRVAFQSSGLTANVAGQTVKMSAAYRFAANAPRIAAAALYLHPGVRTAVSLLSWLSTAKLIYDAASGQWRESSQPFSSQRWRNIDGGLNHSAQDACVYAHGPGTVAAFTSSTSANCIHPDGRNLSTTVAEGAASQSCPAGWTSTPAGCLSPSLTQPDFVDKLSSLPMPENVPWDLPYPTPLPVEQPFINPAPSENPQHNPFFIPIGNPIPNPSYDPDALPSPVNQPWVQPGTELIPSPTSDQPWRVDIRPINRPQSSSSPLPVPVPSDSPPASDNPKPPDDTQGLCEKHPDILACQKLDIPEDQDLPVSEKSISVTPDSGWGAGNASCPAARHFTVQGRDIEIPYDLFCAWARGLRPIILAIAWLSAAYIILGVKD